MLQFRATVSEMASVSAFYDGPSFSTASGQHVERGAAVVLVEAVGAETRNRVLVWFDGVEGRIRIAGELLRFGSASPAQWLMGQKTVRCGDKARCGNDVVTVYAVAERADKWMVLHSKSLGQMLIDPHAGVTSLLKEKALNWTL